MRYEPSHRRPFPDDSARQRVRLLLKELGSSPLTSGGSDEFDETLVIVQTPGERPAAFARRAVERMGALARSGRRVDVARVMTGTHHDPESKAARRLVTLTVVDHAKARGGISELVLDGAAKGGAEIHEQLLELAGEVLAAPQSERIPVRVCFASAVQ